MFNKVPLSLTQANNTVDKLAELKNGGIKLEEFKLAIRICKDACAFPNFNSLQTNIDWVIGIARQNERLMGSSYFK